MRLGYADPPYIGCAHLYKDHPDYAGEVDHASLIERLQAEYDGWVLHAPATPPSPSEEPARVRLREFERSQKLAEERDALRKALEVIALGDAKDPVRDAGDELVALGYWDAAAVAAGRAAAPTPAAGGLTEEEIDTEAEKHFSTLNGLVPHQWRNFARAIESALLAKIGARHG